MNLKKIVTKTLDKINPKRVYIQDLYRSKHQKRVLISYLTLPFLSKHGAPSHTSSAEAKEIAKAFDELGFAVDIIRYDYPFERINFNNSKYDLVFGLEPNFLEAVKRFKPKKSIYYATGAYCEFQNNAETKRLDELKKRRGKMLNRQRVVKNHDSSDMADGVISIGNDWTRGTYKNHAKRIESIRVSAFSNYPLSEIEANKNWSKSKLSFLWFGSVGAVHKGLDLLLDIFPKHKNLHLYICGAVEKEKDFVDLYNKELASPNVHLIGWIDPSSTKFKELMETCAFTILPSCSEGMSSSIATCMYSGLIPLVSRETGIDVVDSGAIFSDNSIKTLEKTIISCSRLSASEIKKQSERSYNFALDNFSLETFASDFRAKLKKLLK